MFKKITLLLVSLFSLNSYNMQRPAEHENRLCQSYHVYYYSLLFGRDIPKTIAPTDIACTTEQYLIYLRLQLSQKQKSFSAYQKDCEKIWQNQTSQSCDNYDNLRMLSSNARDQLIAMANLHADIEAIELKIKNLNQCSRIFIF